MMTSIKTCIFCGKLPAVKTKEHVIPQWLMKMTGDPKRIANFSSLGYDGNGRRAFSFDAFHFPACGPCNNEWSGLEAKAKIVVERILAKATISSFEWNVLLDWLDKVRVGIWLGMRSLEKNFLQIDPKFHIAQRVGAKDRSLVIARAARGKRLTFFGTNTLAFRYMPSCFGLTINDTALLNISCEFLVAKKLGFPYPIAIEGEIEGNHIVQMADGTNNVSALPLDLHVTACATAIHQVIYKNRDESNASELWNQPYVCEHSIDHKSGLSYPFLELESGEVSIMKAIGGREWVPNHVFPNNTMAGQYLAGFCFDIQSKLWSSWVPSILDHERRKDAAEVEKVIQSDLGEFRKLINTMS